jgi:hypothetical protein
MKCTLCGKEFSENTKDSEILNHFLTEHRKEIIETAKNMRKDFENKKKQKVNK